MNLNQVELESLCNKQDLVLSFIDEVESTNSWLMYQSPMTQPHLCVTKHQTAGRGRRGRDWIAERGHSICFSIRLPLNCKINTLNGYSLAVALAIKEVLSPSLSLPLSLKWPNDLLIDNKKLGGILIETATQSSSLIDVVIGIGINVAPIHITDRETISLNEAGWHNNDINLTIVELCRSLIVMSSQFEKEGFAGFADNWQAQDDWVGRRVDVHLANESISGTYEGVNADGMLLLRRGEIISPFIAGEVSLRQ